MLSREQWQWCADNSTLIRKRSKAIIFVLFALYIVLFANKVIDQGQSRIAYAPDLKFIQKFDCDGKLKKQDFISPKSADYRSEANIFLLSQYYTVMLDASSLDTAPECLGAMLYAYKNDPNHTVWILYDVVNKRPLFRIAHIDSEVKK